jgi:hypothetical protein
MLIPHSLNRTLEVLKDAALRVQQAIFEALNRTLEVLKGARQLRGSTLNRTFEVCLKTRPAPRVVSRRQAKCDKFGTGIRSNPKCPRG